MLISERFSTPSSENCTITLQNGEEYNEEKLYKACTNWYNPVLGGMIIPYGKNTYKITVYTD